MIIRTFPGPTLVIHQHSADSDGFQVARKSTTVMIFLDSGVDISTLTHRLDIQQGKNAKIRISIEQHRFMMDAKLITPEESRDNEEVLNCTRAFLQDQQRKGLHVLKSEITIAGDFDDTFVQPVWHSKPARWGWKAAGSDSPFRISYVMGNHNNHTQGVVLTAYVMHSLNKA